MTYCKTLCLTLCLMPLPLFACSQIQPTAAFIAINDGDRDNVLNLQEWMQAHTGGNLEVDFVMGDESEFSRLDYNRNGSLEAREIGFRAVRYIESPCRKFEALRRQHFKNALLRTGNP